MTCSDVKVTNRPAGNCSGGSDQGGKQTEGPEHNEMAATSKIHSAVKSLATCEDFSNEAKAEGGESQRDWRMSP